MEEKKEKESQKKKLSLPLQIVLILMIVIGFRTFVLGTISVKGSSMEPTFIHGDLVALNKMAYTFSEPKKGDIVICGLESGSGGNIIKRVIGLPGDEIDFQEKDTYELEYGLYINGELQDEPYLPEPIQQPGNVEYPYTVPENSYFVMGDNRNVSTDSRTQSIGAIDKKEVQGKVILRLYPLSRFGTVN